MSHRLLVVSNDQEVIDEIKSFLELWKDWEVFVYSNPQKAWVDYVKAEPDLSIVDLDCVGTDISTPPPTDTQLPLMVFLSSNSRSSYDAMLAVQWGAIEFLQKPIRLEDLVLSLSIAQGPVDEPSPSQLY